MKKSISAPNLTTLPMISKLSPTCPQSPIYTPSRRASNSLIVCQSFDALIHDIALSYNLQVITKSPMHHVAHCLASGDEFPEDLLSVSKDLATCIATPFEEVNDENILSSLKQSKMQNQNQADRAGELFVRIRRSRSKKL